MNRDVVLLLDMFLAAADAKTFTEGLDAAAFEASRLHQSAVIRCLEVIGEAAGRFLPRFAMLILKYHGARLSACVID